LNPILVTYGCIPEFVHQCTNWCFDMAIDRALAHVSSKSPRARYRKRSLYVRTPLAWAFRRRALSEGFRVGDLARMLVMAGMVVHLLHLDEQRWASETRTTSRIRQLNQILGQGVKHPYSSFRSTHRGSVWVTVCLPVGFLTFVDQYARLRGESRNGVLQRFFQLGLLAYLHGRTRFLQAIAGSPEKPGTT